MHDPEQSISSRPATAATLQALVLEIVLRNDPLADEHATIARWSGLAIAFSSDDSVLTRVGMAAFARPELVDTAQWRIVGSTFRSRWREPAPVPSPASKLDK